MKEAFVFVYAKEGKIKVISLHQAMNDRYNLQKNGWTHTTTLDACVFLEHLHNNIKNRDEVIKNLSEI